MGASQLQVQPTRYDTRIADSVQAMIAAFSR
jgi:hypothetical protein